jgi:oligopeptide/dipeptide ABC transporter ATP-binding protein
VTALLDVRHLDVTAGTEGSPVTIVEDVSFTVERGEVLGLAGESGSGKTMSALAVMGILPGGTRTAGEVRFADQNVLGLRGRPLRQIQGRRIAMVFQDPSSALHPMLTVGRQLTEHARYHLGLSRRAAEERALELLGQVRIPTPRAALKAYPHQFSGGMRQRIQIAIALACEPDVLIADEPTTALDVTIQAGVLRLFDRLRREEGLAILLITHDLGVLSALADRVVVMYAGRVIESCAIGELMNDSRHPYTRALLSSLPRPDAEGAELVPIRGTPPSPAGRPSGCAFHPRCEFAVDTCTSAVPELAGVGAGHRFACPVDPFGNGSVTTASGATASGATASGATASGAAEGSGAADGSTP